MSKGTDKAVGAVCDLCERDMKATDRCETVPIEFPGDPEKYAPVPYGQEMRYGAFVPGEMRERCHDCNVAVGQPHHPGCDWEECPKCHHQAIGCECWGNQ